MAVAFQPEGELIATGSSENTVTVVQWHATDGEDDGKLRLIDAATGDVGREVSHGDAPLRGAAFHPSGELISEHLPVWNRAVLTRIALAADAAGVVAPFEDGADASTSEKRRLPMMQT